MFVWMRFSLLIQYRWKFWKCGQIMHINLSRCVHLRSTSMWCLGMPDCMAWGLCHTVKLEERFPTGKKLNPALRLEPRVLQLWFLSILVWKKNKTWTSFRWIPAGKQDLCYYILKNKRIKEDLWALQSHPWWTSSSAEVSREEGECVDKRWRWCGRHFGLIVVELRARKQ